MQQSSEDCASVLKAMPLLPASKSELDRDLLAGLHPATRDGMALLAQCISPAIDSVLRHETGGSNWFG